MGLFKRISTRYFFLTCLLFSGLVLFGQNQGTVTGVVKDNSGEPLIGVNIQVKNSNKGTSTDFDGAFTLEDIDENAILIISYVGYQTQEVFVAGKHDLEIVMLSDSQVLDEVVVVGYGTQSREELTT